MESSFIVPYTIIKDILPHPNADRLSIAKIYDFDVVVAKDLYKVGQKVIYCPIDSILPENIEKIVFPEGSKIKLNNSRVRQIKIRNFYSQGLIINPESLLGLVNFNYIKDEQDLSGVLNITKFEPPLPKFQQIPNKMGKQRKNLPNELFHSYNGLTNIKFLPNLFDGKEVVITEKIHGSNSRFSILPRPTRTFMDKVKKLFGLLPRYEYLYGSNKVDITNSSNYVGYYGDDIYGKVFKRINAKEKVKPNEIIYGELYGPKIQKNYEYGQKEVYFILFDVKIYNEKENSFRWLNPEEVEEYAKERGFAFVPVLYKGIYNKELSIQLSQGPSVLDPNTKVKEGIVIKDRYNYTDENGNKVAVKLINPEYLQNPDNTDFH